MKNLLKYFSIPAGMLLLSVFVLWRLKPVNSSDAYNTVLGITIGVLLGFIADIFKRSLDDYLRNKDVSKTALQLLVDDAKSIYHLFWLFDRARTNPNSPKEIREISIMPPKIDLRYWPMIRQDKEFLILGAQEPFTKIFKDFFEIDKLNTMIERASDDNEKRMCMGIFAISLKDQFHKQILKYFLSDNEINILEQKWILDAGTKRQTGS